MTLPKIDSAATGRNIAAIRAADGMTVRQLAMTIGCTEATIYRWMRGESVPSTEELVKFIFLFNVDLEDVIAFKIEKEKR